jgi:NADP-dependent 3-hydroxy acid dehydrogenase YdfG
VVCNQSLQEESMPIEQEGAPQSFSNKVIWITGASSGIGEALAREFARLGARVVLSARREGELARVRGQCMSDGARAQDLLVLPLDVVDYGAMPAAVGAVLGAFSRIDMLINNAGISQRSFCLDTDMKVYRRLLEVDVLGQIALTREVLPVMVEQGAGHLVATASVAGKVGVPLRTGYCAAKHAVMGFFDALRTEVAELGIRVSTVIPGFIRTNVSANALAGSGEATGVTDEDIAGGMEPAKCAEVIIAALAAGEEEIAVGQGPEMDLLALKRTHPDQAFRLLETMAGQIRASRK